jgi:hypothetical protein
VSRAVYKPGMPRFMLLMYPNVTHEQYEQGVRADDAGPMMRFNETLMQAGALLAIDGLHPASKGARVTLAGGRTTVTDGPFTEAKELVGGYWLIDVKSKEEAVEWASRAPINEGDVIEVRQVFEIEDHSAEVQATMSELSQAPPEQTRARQPGP